MADSAKKTLSNNQAVPESPAGSPEYRINPDLFHDVVALPGMLFDGELKFASGDQLKVLLWIFRNGRSSLDINSCAKETGVKPKACGEALNYWFSRALILPTDGTLLPGGKSGANSVSESNTAKGSSAKQARDKAPHNPIMGQATFSDSSATTAKIFPVKPSVKEVIDEQKGNSSFAFLLNETSRCLGKPITHGEMQSLLYIYKTANLPVEVLMLIVQFAITQSKGNIRYIEKVALDWAEKGLNNIEAAEAHLCEMERRITSWQKVGEFLGIDKRPSASEMNAAERWLYEWNFSADLIKLAFDLCLKKIGKFRSSYIDKVLSSWKLDGIDTVEKALKELDPKKPQVGGNMKKGPATKDKAVSLDFDEYEDMLDSYVPVYKD